MAKDPDCIFCKIIDGELPSFQVYEDDRTLAFMDINPANPGHTLVIPKFHAPNVFELPDDWLGDCAQTARKIAQAQREALPLDGINILQANGDGAGQSVLHFHFHVLPRHLGDDLKLIWGLVPGDMDEIAAIGEKIRGAIA